MNKPFRSIFKAALTFSKDSYALFDVSLTRFLAYFILINFIMFIPLTFSIYQLDTSIQTLLGIRLSEGSGLADLPETCEIVNEELLCETDTVYTHTFSVNDQVITVLINENANLEPEPYQLVMAKQTAVLRLNDDSIPLDYRGFGYSPFSDLNATSTDAVYEHFFTGFYPSVRPFFALPLILVFVGGYILTNIILLFTLAGFAMLFKLTLYDLPRYKNMLKLFIIASTIPAIINLGIGLFGLSAFSSLVYNFLTPFFVYILYRKKDPEVVSK